MGEIMNRQMIDQKVGHAAVALWLAVLGSGCDDGMGPDPQPLRPLGLAFVSQRDGNQEIYRMNPDGSGQVRLTNNPGRDLNPVWSPEGDRIAFRSEHQGDSLGYDIYVMNANGGTQTWLDVPVLCCDFTFMTWSPDGQMVAVTTPDDINQGHAWHVSLVNVVTRAVTQPAPSQTSNFDPVWSPDGRRIVFRSDDVEDADLYLVSAVPGRAERPVRLTNNAVVEYVPYWSPDGQKIVFVSERSGNEYIYVIGADGSAQINLTKNAAKDRNPQWSPDGQKIAFVSDRDGSTGIYVMNADGSALTYLTDAAGNDDDPQWSPDGQKIAFVSSRDGNAEIYVMNSDGSGQTNLTNNPGIDNTPRWRP